MLKTDYKNDELDTSINDRRKYNLLTNADGTVSFEDVTAYQQTGDTFGAQDINETNKVANMVSNPNLLVNSFFTVNQRGKSEYGGNIYTVDRWKSVLAGSGTLTFNAQTKELKGTINATGNYASLAQAIEKPSWLSNKTVTLSANVLDKSTDGGWSLQIWYTPKGGSTVSLGQTFFLDDKNAPLEQEVTVTLPTINDNDLLRVLIQTRTSVTIKSIKLELGSVSTLANDIAPDYQTELIKCGIPDDSDTTFGYRPANISLAQVEEETTVNLVPYPYHNNSGRVSNGITFTVNSDGTIIANGTATGNATFSCTNHTGVVMELANGTYNLSGCPSGGNVSNKYDLRVERRTTSGTPNTVCNDIGSAASFNWVDGNDLIPCVMIVIRNGVVCNNLTFKPMLVKGAAAKPYTPPTNPMAKGTTLAEKFANFSQKLIVTNTDPGEGASVPYSDGTVIMVYED